MSNNLDNHVLNAAERLELAVKQSTAAADRLLKCAESISNPVYHVVMDGKVLDILAVQHFAGQINIQVKSNLNDLGQRRPMLARVDTIDQFIGANPPKKIPDVF